MMTSWCLGTLAPCPKPFVLSFQRSCPLFSSRCHSITILAKPPLTTRPWYALVSLLHKSMIVFGTKPHCLTISCWTHRLVIFSFQMTPISLPCIFASMLWFLSFYGLPFNRAYFQTVYYIKLDYAKLNCRMHYISKSNTNKLQLY